MNAKGKMKDVFKEFYNDEPLLEFYKNANFFEKKDFDAPKGKMSKSNSKESNISDIDESTKIRALRNEINYWKTRYKLIKKYGVVDES
jgi:hypothetical protein